MSGLDIFLGDPIYDDQHRVVRRDFGVKNVIAIAITLYVGNLLMGQMKPKSGGGKMKGGEMRWTREVVSLLLLALFFWGAVEAVKSAPVVKHSYHEAGDQLYKIAYIIGGITGYCILFAGAAASAWHGIVTFFPGFFD